MCKMNKKFVLFFSFVLLGIFTLKAQDPLVIVEHKNIDLTYLESLVKENIDSIRKEFKLKSLHNDSLLYISAKHHAEYCKQNHSLLYYEDSRKNKTPQKRASACGALDYLVGEIIAKLVLDSAYSYKIIADSLTTLIISDTLNFAHILSRMYNITGLAIDIDNNTLMLINDLAKTNKEYVYRLSPSVFLYDKEYIATNKKKVLKSVKKYDWKLKPPKKEVECEDLLRVLKRMKIADVVHDDKRLSVLFDSESSAKQLIEKKKDGFAIEVISFYDYSCNTLDYYKPSKRNDLSLINGTLMRPRYYEDIFKEGDFGDENPKDFKRDIGSIKTNSEIFEANAIILKNNKICAVLKPSQICGQPFSYIPEKLPYLDNLYDPNYEPPITYDTLKLKIYFKVGETVSDDKEIQKIIDFVKREGLVITKSFVNANASIEGNPKTNNILFNQRADYIISLFEKEQEYHIRKKVKTQENWSLFYSQIRNTKFSGLAYKDTSYVRYFVNDSLEYFTEMLDKQRYVQVNLFAVTKATRDKYKVFAITEYKKLIKQINEAIEKNKPKQVARLIEKAEEIQLFLFDQYNRRKVKLSFVNLMKIPDQKEFTTLKFNRLMSDFNHVAKSKRIKEYKFFDEIKKFSTVEDVNSLVFYNLLAYVINHYGDTECDEYQNSKKLLSLIKSTNNAGIDDEYSQGLSLHYNYIKAEEVFETMVFKRARNSLAFIYNYYKKQDNFSEQTLTNIAEYFILFNEYKKAKDIVKPLAFSENPNHDALVLYLKLHYMDYWKQDRTEDYYRPLFDATKILSNEKWCNMFAGDCNISFQIFDYEPLWKLYCLKKQIN